MKVYIVTTGAYSDYSIDKVFTDREKAEEYRKWCYDANDVEEYDTEDDCQINKYYKICITYRINDNGRNNEPDVRIEKCCSGFNNRYTNVSDWHRYGGQYVDIALVRYIPEVNWNEEFYTKKYTKAIYDLAAQARQLLFYRWTDNQINEMWNSTLKD